jgi:hypothetical protein
MRMPVSMVIMENEGENTHQAQHRANQNLVITLYPMEL